MDQKSLDYFTSLKDTDLLNISPFLLFHYICQFETQKKKVFRGMFRSFFPMQKKTQYSFVRQRILIERKILYAIKSKLSRENQEAVSSFGISSDDVTLAISIFNTLNRHINEEYDLIKNSEDPKEPELSVLISKISDMIKRHNKEQDDEGILKQLDLVGKEIKNNKGKIRNYISSMTGSLSRKKNTLKLALVSLCLVLTFYKANYAQTYDPAFGAKTATTQTALGNPKIFVVGNSHMVGLKKYLKRTHSPIINNLVLEDSYKNTSDSMKIKRSDVRDFSCYVGRNILNMLNESDNIILEMNKQGCNTAVIYEGTNSLVAIRDLSKIDSYAKQLVQKFHAAGKKVFFEKMPISLSNAPIGPHFNNYQKMMLSQERINHYNNFTITNSGCDGIIGSSNVDWKLDGRDPIHGMTISTYKQWCNSLQSVRNI